MNASPASQTQSCSLLFLKDLSNPPDAGGGAGEEAARGGEGGVASAPVRPSALIWDPSTFSLVFLGLFGMKTFAVKSIIWEFLSLLGYSQTAESLTMLLITSLSVCAHGSFQKCRICVFSQLFLS